MSSGSLPAARYPGFRALLLGLTVWCAACERGSDPSTNGASPGIENSPAPDGMTSHKAEFLAIARTLTDGDNAFFGSRQVSESQRRLAAATNAEERVQVAVDLTLDLLRQGEVDRARATIDEAWRTVQDDRSLARAMGMVANIRALTLLRAAETQNCILAPNAECCLFPFRGGGVHARPEPAKEAFALYRWMLQFMPENLQLRWLANVADPVP
jgi:hypothetical protein